MSQPGLCGHCHNARRLVSGKGSIFWLCGLGQTDPRFPKYPRLPVAHCDGYNSHIKIKRDPPPEPDDQTD